jgi:hypothetical protein
MTWVVLVIVAAAVMYGLHRTALWAEERGWIFYRKKRGPAPWLGSLDAIYKPEIEHVIEEQSSQETRADQDASGDRPDPGSPT